MSRTYGFHDAEVLDLSLVKRSLRLVLVCFTETDGVTMPVSIVFRDVRDLAIDGVADGTISKVNDDGSVIGLTMEDGRAHLLIEWMDYKNKKNSKTVSYQFTFKNAQTRAGH